MPRRLEPSQSSSSTLSPYTSGPPTPQAPPTPSRAPIAQFLTRPSKWFTRSTSAPRVGGGLSPGEESPRASTSSVSKDSGARKPKISRPTDPRPILDAEGYRGVPGSRSVLDLTRPSLNLASATAKSSLDLRLPPSPSANSSPLVRPGPGNSPYGGAGGQGIYGAGDLRAASRRPWSKSADDLRMNPAPAPPPIPRPGGIKASASVGGGVVHAHALPRPPQPSVSLDTAVGLNAHGDSPGRQHIRVDTQLSFVDKVAAYRSNSGGPEPERVRADSLGTGSGLSPLSGSNSATTMTPTTGSFTGTPLTHAPLPIPFSSNNAYPTDAMPIPHYARQRTDSERSGRSFRSGRSGTGTGEGSPGSTPPSARGGGTGMAWPAIGGAGGGRDSPHTNGSGSAHGHGGGGERSPGSTGVTVSVSAPMLDGAVHDFGGASGGLGAGLGMGGTTGAGNGGAGNGVAPEHVHTRSYSFTPKLPSRLASLGIASPGRKGSAGELDIVPPPVETKEREPKDKERRGLFHFGGGTQKPLPPDPSAGAALAPPHIIFEPASPAHAHDASPRNARDTLFAFTPAAPLPTPTANNEKRSSQVVYASGFINRLVSPALSDSRSWKPFKMEVRGAKLVLHKPPGDRVAGMRELFPAGIVDEEGEEEAKDKEGEHADEATAPRGGMGGVVRKKRAYWGRARHPALGVVEAGAFELGSVLSAEPKKHATRGKVEKGTMEALVHELVFATVFLNDDITDDEQRAQREEQWRDYALAVLLCLPLLAVGGRTRFEAELVRCAGYLVSGALPNEIDATRGRVGWIAREYLRLHGPPADAAAWDVFCADAIPDVVFPSPLNGLGMAASASMQAMYAPSPVLGASSPAITANTFSPRPDDGERMVGLLDALGVHELIPGANTLGPPLGSSVSPRSPQRSGSGLTLRMPWAALESEGLSRNVLLAIDPSVLARSLTLFHRAVLEQAPENPTVSFVDIEAGGGEASAALFGCDAAPHWLTKFVLLQVLGADTGVGAGTTPGGDGYQQQQHQAPTTSRTHSRSEVISVWARVGELCRAAGDECSWRAIVAALCAPAVARLDKVWRRVEPPALAAVEAWAWARQDDTGGGAGEGEALCEVREPRVTPWGGDIRARFKDEVEAARLTSDAATAPAEEIFLVAPMERALDGFEGFRKQFLLCPRRVTLPQDEVGEEVKLMVGFWREKCAEGGGNAGIAAKLIRVDQFMSLSLAAEPRKKGLFEPHYWTRAANQTPYASLIPLLFPEVFPTTTLVDRTQLLRGRVDSDTDPRFLLLDPQQPRPLRKDIGGLGQNGTVIPVYNGEVLLSVWNGSGGDSTASSRPSSRLPSRPPSSVVSDAADATLGRAPSVRVKPGSSHGLDRKTSLARRNSLPSLSLRRTFIASEPSSEPPLRVRVLAGSLNWLVDILVHGLQNVSVSVADDNGEMSLREGKTRELVVDQVEFSKLWWNVYRSLVTPLVFFELLRKMYLQTRPRGAVPAVAELLFVAGSRTEILDTIKDWLTRGGGAQDVLDDVHLYVAVQSFLEADIDHDLPSSANASDPSVEQTWSALADVRSGLKRTFKSHTMRPPAPFPTIGPLPNPAVNGQRARLQNQTREPPEIDRLDPQELVDNLDAMACAAFSNVTEEDLYITADLLEAQTADRIGWFLSFAPSEDTIEIQNMYSYLQEIEPSPLISELGQDSLYRLLPPGVRSCIRAYVILRKWTVSQIVAPRLGLRARQSRMELILRAIEVSRLRNLPSHAMTPQAIVDLPCRRSFVEAVLTSAVLSVESRIHSRPWLNIAMSRGTQCDSVASLLAQPSTQTPSSARELTLDVGWFLERMLEIIAAPDVVESVVQQDGHSLINVDKRRHLCTLITSLRKGSYREDVTRKAFERLNNIEKDIWMLQFDHRGIKDEAQREGNANPGASPAATRRAVRPFQKTINLQLEKNKRDRTLRSRLYKERVQEQTRNDKREDLINKAMRKQPATPQQKHQRSKKSMSAFLHFMRPISSAFGNDHTLNLSAVKRTPEELDFVPSGKPSLVVSLVDARIAQLINNDRSFVFQVDSDDGGHYILQAISKRDMTKWVDSINRVTQTTARRRLTYLGAPKPQLADHLHDGTISASRDPHAVFGVDLTFLLRREVGGDDIPPGTIPSVIERCLSEIEARGLTEVGIYRLAGAASVINALRDAFNRGEDPIESTTDIHAVCDLVKSWFRLLPEPLFPAADYHLAIEAAQMENLDDRLAAIRKVVHGLPQTNFDLLLRVAEHLDKVADLEEYNQMTAEGLAIVFSPNLLRAPQENFAMILANMAHAHKLVRAIITHFHVIFDEGDIDAEVEAEPYDESDGEDEHTFTENAPALDDVQEEEDVEDIPPTIKASLDQSPLDFSSSNHLLAP